MHTRTLTHAHTHSLSHTHTRARFLRNPSQGLPGASPPIAPGGVPRDPDTPPSGPSICPLWPPGTSKSFGGAPDPPARPRAYGSKPRTVFLSGPQRQTWPYIETLCKSNDRKVSCLKRLWRPHLLRTPRAAIRAHGALIRTTRIQHHHHLTILTRGWGIRSRVPPGSKPRVGNWHMAFPLVGSAA